MGSSLTSRGWTYSKQAATIIVICVTWAYCDVYNLRPWYWFLVFWLGPWVDTWGEGFKLTAEIVTWAVFALALIWALRPSDLRLEYSQQ